MMRTIGIATYNRRQHKQWSRVEMPCLLFGIDELVVAPQTAMSTDKGSWNDKTPLFQISNGVEHPSLSISLTCIGSPVLLPNGKRVLPGQETELSLPTSLFVEESTIELFSPVIVKNEPNEALPPTVSQLPSWVHHGRQLAEANLQDSPPITSPPSAATLSEWFSALGSLQRHVAGSQSFFKCAAKAVFEPGGLDVGMILLKQGDDWIIQSSYLPRGDNSISFDSNFVDLAASKKKTIFHDATKSKGLQVPEPTNKCLVASPILDSSNQVIGMVYCAREAHQRNQRFGIRALEAQFVSLIAESVAAALCRFEMEANATRDQILLEHAFPPEVASALKENNGILEPKLTEITSLFCDIRQFTDLAENASAKLIYEFLAESMDMFSQIVTDHSGVIIDYFGDGFAAFWNAPISRHDHPRLACQAGLKLLESMDGLNERWQSIFDQQIEIGVGIHTGEAMVGNSGSRRRIKYGPRGNTVAIAHRLQNLSKVFHSPLVVSETTACRIHQDFLAVRLGKLALKGFNKPTNVFGLLQSNCSSQELSACQQYEIALEQFELGNYFEASTVLKRVETSRVVLPFTKYLRNEIESGQTKAINPGDVESSDR